MKRKLPIILIILICFCALTVFSSCEFVLDLIFGPPASTDPPDSDEPPAHTHSMQKRTLEGVTCVGDDGLAYYQCDGCGKSYLDEKGSDEVVCVSELDKWHLCSIEITGDEHYFKCRLCNTEREDSRAKHSSDRWWFNPDSHYKLCDVCGVKFGEGAHDETGSCKTCGRQADYKAICNTRYGYDLLAEWDNGEGMRKLYDKIDEVVSSAHGNKNLNLPKRNIGQTPDGETVYAYALSEINANDCEISVADAYVTVASYCHDNPLYYWLGKQCSASYPKSDENKPNSQRRAGSITLRVVDEYADGDARAAQNDVLYSEIDRYLSIAAGKTDPYEITLALHDEMIDSVKYALKSDGVTPQDEHWAHSIVGVFDKKSSVCEGYAKAFQLLLNACNVDNVYVTGTSLPKGAVNPVGHAWNLVKLSNGQWYWYDLTWDDQPALPNGKIYDYFCQTDKAFKENHTPTSSNADVGMNYLYPLPAAAEENYNSTF